MLIKTLNQAKKKRFTGEESKNNQLMMQFLKFIFISKINKLHHNRLKTTRFVGL